MPRCFLSTLAFARRLSKQRARAREPSIPPAHKATLLLSSNSSSQVFLPGGRRLRATHTAKAIDRGPSIACPACSEQASSLTHTHSRGSMALRQGASALARSVLQGKSLPLRGGGGGPVKMAPAPDKPVRLFVCACVSRCVCWWLPLTRRCTHPSCCSGGALVQCWCSAREPPPTRSRPLHAPTPPSTNENKKNQKAAALGRAVVGRRLCALAARARRHAHAAALHAGAR